MITWCSKGKKKEFYPLELELRLVVMNQHVGAGNKPRSSVRATGAINCCDISPVPSNTNFILKVLNIDLAEFK